MLSRADVIAALGAVDDATIAEILATGASAEELAEAQAWSVNDEPLINNGRTLAGGRVARLVDVLCRLRDEEEAEEDNRAG